MKFCHKNYHTKILKKIKDRKRFKKDVDVGLKLMLIMVGLIFISILMSKQ